MERVVGLVWGCETLVPPLPLTHTIPFPSTLPLTRCYGHLCPHQTPLAPPHRMPNRMRDGL